MFINCNKHGGQGEAGGGVFDRRDQSCELIVCAVRGVCERRWCEARWFDISGGVYKVLFTNTGADAEQQDQLQV